MKIHTSYGLVKIISRIGNISHIYTNNWRKDKIISRRKKCKFYYHVTKYCTTVKTDELIVTYVKYISKSYKQYRMKKDKEYVQYNAILKLETCKIILIMLRSINICS